MNNGSRLSRGDRNRNARLGRLRALVSTGNAIVAIDLADRKQMLVITDHDSKILARRTFRCRAWDMGGALDWARQRAAAAGFAAVTVACEPTGHRWRVLGQLAADRGMAFVCVQPAMTSWSRLAEDLTHDKTDEKDAVLIARLTAQLRCYVPEPVDETWGRLRHLGARREQLLVEMVSQVQQIRALLECVWPAALDAARQPFRSPSWVAAMRVICDRDHGDLARTRRLGSARFEHAVRREVVRAGGQKPSLRIIRNLFAALNDPAGVLAHRRGALERVLLLLEDWTEDKTSAGRHRNTDGLRARRTRAHRPGHLDRRALRGRRRGDPGRNRRSDKVSHCPGRGQTRRSRAPGETIRDVHRPHETHRARPTGPAAGRLARGLGNTTRQPGLRGPLPAPDQPRHQPPHPHPSPSRDRRRDHAAPARRRHHRATLGSPHRHARNETGAHQISAAA